MTSEKNYFRMVVFFDKYYQKTKLDDLGGLLGSMDPSLWKNRKPIDPSMLDDWNRVTKGKKKLSEKECFTAMIEFVKFQENEFKYDFSQLISDLENNYNEIAKDWKDSLTEATELYEKLKSESS